MNASGIRIFLFFIALGFIAGCANITAPTGGKKDTIPPKLLSVDPKDSLLNTRVSRIELHFDEFVTVSDVTKEVHISPILAVPPVVTGLNKHVVVKIPDTLLEDNTTYRISFGNAIKDVHEGNPFSHYTYTFSTGSYFDSLQLSGKVINAATGLPDSNVLITLYPAGKSDSAVVKEKPKYVVKAENDGTFVMKGLPAKSFRIYALKDPNDNLIYDGAPEMIAFMERTVTPGDTTQPPILLRLFTEPVDTSINKTDTGGSKKGGGSLSRKTGKNDATGPSYSVNVDTSNASKRTFEITGPLEIRFTARVTLNKDHILLSYDSSGINVPIGVRIDSDTTKKNVYLLRTAWHENTVYTLKLQKGFAKDTANADLLPSRYTFRTKEDEDYGRLQVHVPAKYFGKQYLLVIKTGNDTIYNKPVLDTVVSLRQLKPATYTFRIIVDKNENGKWDTGNLFEKLQPEEVIPGSSTETLKPGWENIVDFEQKPQKRLSDRAGVSQPKSK